jgi:hypothetical protein
MISHHTNLSTPGLAESNSIGMGMGMGGLLSSSAGGMGLKPKSAPLTLQSDQIVSAKSARTRFTGGGFAIK